MPLKIRKGYLWRKEIDNKPGALAESIAPFADATNNLQIIMGYAKASDNKKGAIEIFPVSDEKDMKVATDNGLRRMSEVTCLIVEGENRTGLTYELAHAIAQDKINLHFAMYQSFDGRFQACFGFENDEDAEKAWLTIAKF